jgi:hypothetical protein
MPKSTQAKKTWQYSKKFKLEAVKLTLLYDYCNHHSKPAHICRSF